MQIKHFNSTLVLNKTSSAYGLRPVSRFCNEMNLPSKVVIGQSQELGVKYVSYYEKTETATQDAFLKLQCNCVLCNTTLEFKFEMITQEVIKEEATCPQCEIRARAKIHSLQ